MGLFDLFNKKTNTDDTVFSKFFSKYPDHKVIKRPSASTINEYKSVLPSQVLDFWQKYGYGIYMDGYLKMVDPADYDDAFSVAISNADDMLVFAVSGLGDFFTWDGSTIGCVNFRHGYYFSLETSSLAFVLNDYFTQDGYLKEVLFNQNYYPAQERLGKLSFEECFGYVPILGMGGAEKPENLQKVKTNEHIRVIAHFMGKIEP